MSTGNIDEKLMSLWHWSACAMEWHSSEKMHKQDTNGENCNYGYLFYYNSTFNMCDKYWKINLLSVACTAHFIMAYITKIFVNHLYLYQFFNPNPRCSKWLLFMVVISCSCTLSGSTKVINSWKWNWHCRCCIP